MMTPQWTSEPGAAYLKLNDKPVAVTEDLGELDVMIDRADDGTIVGVEFLGSGKTPLITLKV
jgi:uncharacterized protein YuzE